MKPDNKDNDESWYIGSTVAWHANLKGSQRVKFEYKLSWGCLLTFQAWRKKVDNQVQEIHIPRLRPQN